MRTEPHLRVLHVGVLGDEPGGMAQVLNRYLSWRFDGVDVAAVASTRRRHDPMWPLLTLRALFRLVGFAARRGNRVAVFHLSERGSFLREGGLLLAAHAMGVPVVAHLHGAEFAAFTADRPGLVRRILGRADAIGALTQATRGVVDGLLGAGANVRLVPNGIDVPDAVDADAKERIVLFGGELGERKGVDLLLGAWAALAPEFPEWTLQLAGPGDEYAARARSLSGTEVLGPLPNAELLVRLRGALVAVLPSRDEALPMFLLEGMAAGCCLVSTNVGEVPSIVGEEDGVLIEPGREDLLREALRGLLGRPREEVVRLGMAGHRLARARYSEESVKPQLVALWWSAVARRSGS